MSDRSKRFLKFHECWNVSPDYCDGVAGVEIDDNGVAWLVFFREQRCIESNDLERYVVARVIMPRATMLEAAALMMTAEGANNANIVIRAERERLN